jgi:hypothetical protein
MNSTTDTEVVTDIDETFRVCRAKNSKNSDKKNFAKSFCFDRDKSKILKMVKNRFYKKRFFQKLLINSFLHIFTSKQDQK